jgi:hypothetical protein
MAKGQQNSRERQAITYSGDEYPLVIYSLAYTAKAKWRKKFKEEQHPDRLSELEQDVIDSYKMKLNKVAYNNFDSIRHVGHRCNELERWARMFMTGWPWKGNPKMCNLGTPQLVACAEMYAKRLREIFKVQHGRDIGRLDD